jgi:hypothetical protein
MKTNGRDTNGGSLCGVPGASCSSGDWRQAYANYLVAYIKFYAEAGVNITHVGFLNEPDYSASYASMQSNGNQAADFIKVLHPTLEAAGLGAQVGITCCDSMNWNNQASMVGQIRSAGAEGMLKAVTSHSYTGGSGGPMNARAPVWLSEQCKQQSEPFIPLSGCLGSLSAPETATLLPAYSRYTPIRNNMTDIVGRRPQRAVDHGVVC